MEIKLCQTEIMQAVINDLEKKGICKNGISYNVRLKYNETDKFTCIVSDNQDTIKASQEYQEAMENKEKYEVHTEKRKIKVEEINGEQMDT